MSKRAIQKLHRLLEVERAALLAGELDKIDDLAPQKEALIKDFGKTSNHELSGLSGALARNEALLTAAHDGVALVLKTLGEQRKARQTLQGYDSTGKATSISQSTHGTERRF